MHDQVLELDVGRREDERRPGFGGRCRLRRGGWRLDGCRGLRHGRGQLLEVHDAIGTAPGDHRTAAHQHLLDVRRVLREVEAEVRERELREPGGIGLLADAADAEFVDCELVQVEGELRGPRSRQEIVGPVEGERARSHVEAGGLAHVGPMPGRIDVGELEVPLRGERCERERAAPVERRARPRLGVQVVGVVGAAGRAEIPQLEAERPEVGGVRRCERAVLEVRMAVGHAEERDEEPRRSFVLGLGRLREGLRKVREIEFAARTDHGPDIGLSNRDFLEARAGAPEARELEVDEQRVEARERLAVRVREAEAVDRQLERERVEPHLANGELALVVLVGELLGLGPDDPGYEPETRGGVSGDEHRQRRREYDQLPRDAEQGPLPACRLSSRASLRSRTPRCRPLPPGRPSSGP